MFSDGKTDFLVSLSSDTGAEQWRVPLAAAFPPRDGSTGGPVSTPAIDSGIVYALGPRGDLLAVQLSSGKELWHRKLVEQLGAAEPHWGFTTSPLVTGELVIVLTGGSPDRAVTAFNKRTGATVWRSASDDASYQSPILIQVAGGQALIVGGDKYLFALDPRDGREIWRYQHNGEGFYARIINPVVVAPDRLLLTYKPDESILLRIASPPEVAWSTREIKRNFGTPVVHNGFIFGYSGGFLSCIDAGSGAQVWRSRPPGDGFVILVDGHLVVLTKQGAVSVAEAGPAGYHEDASLEVFSKLVWTPPSFAEGRIFARDSYSEIAAVDVVPLAKPVSTASTAKPAAGKLPASQFARWVADVESAPDSAEKVKRFLEMQKTFPVIEGDRFAHILYFGPVNDIVLRIDAIGESLVRGSQGSPLPLHRVGNTDLYYASFELEPDARIAYQFNRNRGEDVADPRNPLQATSLSYLASASLLLMPRAERPLMPQAAPALRGRVVEREFESTTARAEHLRWGGRRTLHVYLPPGYDDDPQRRYPVAYILYGAEMLKEARLDALIDREIGATLPPVIAVFLESTSPYEYARTFHAQHARMLAEELVPWIDSRFRTLAQPAQRVLIGADEAGFNALETGVRFPAFGNVISQAPLHVNAGDQELFALISGARKSSQHFFLDWGRYDARQAIDRVDVVAFSTDVRDRLSARGFHVTSRQWNDGMAMPVLASRAIHSLKLVLGLAAAK